MKKYFKYKNNNIPNKDENKGVIILLHGYGDNYINFFNNIQPNLLVDYFVVCLEAPIDIGFGQGWCDISFIDGVKTYNLEQLEISRKMVIDYIYYIKKTYDIDSNNIILLGNSQGAVLAQSVALTSPESINSIIALSGYIKLDAINNMASFESIRKLNFFIGHGSLDVQVHVDLDRDSKKYLESNNVKLVYNEYPIGHSISTNELSDINNWINKINE